LPTFCWLFFFFIVIFKVHLESLSAFIGTTGWESVSIKYIKRWWLALFVLGIPAIFVFLQRFVYWACNARCFSFWICWQTLSQILAVFTKKQILG
jgi:hypothetical protein